MSYFRSILSVWIVFHLFSIVFYPARGFNSLSKQMYRWIGPYNSLLGFQHTWNFYNFTEFGQGYLAYSYGTKTLSQVRENGVFPDSNERPWLHLEQWNRTFPLLNLMGLYPKELQNEAIGSFLCQKHPSATDFRMNIELIPPQPLYDDDVAFYIKNIVRARALNWKWTYSCPPSNG